MHSVSISAGIVVVILIGLKSIDILAKFTGAATENSQNFQPNQDPLKQWQTRNQSAMRRKLDRPRLAGKR